MALADGATGSFHGPAVLPGIHAAAQAAFFAGGVAVELPTVEAAVGTPGSEYGVIVILC